MSNHSFKIVKKLASVLIYFLLWLNPTAWAGSDKVLTGSVSVCVQNKQARLESDLLNSPNIPCQLKPSLYRLIEASSNPTVFKLVFKHMLNEELVFADAKTIDQIKSIAKNLDLEL